MASQEASMVIPMPRDRERVPGQGRADARASRDLPLALRDAQGDLSPLAAIVATWLILCQRHSVQDLVQIDYGVWQGSLGWQIRTLGYAREDSPRFIDLAQGLALQLARARPGSPASNIAFFVLEAPASADAVAPLLAAYEMLLTVSLQGDSEGRVELFYDAGVFERVRIEGWLDLLLRWAQSFREEPSLDTDALPLLSPEAIAAQARRVEPAAAAYPSIPIPQLIWDRAREQPSSPAVHCAGETLTYGGLAGRALELAAALDARGVREGAVVGICLPPHLDLLPAILAVWRLGAIYLPIDPSHPEAYTRHMLEVARPDLIVLLGAAGSDDKGPSFRGYPLLLINSLGPSDAAAPQSAAAALGLDRPAYLFFTSGTTGQPKGVLASHRNLEHYILAAQRAFAFEASDVFCSIARYTFSISLFDLLSPLCVGAQLHLLRRQDVLDPERLISLLAPVSVLHAGPSLLSSLFRHIEAHPSLPSALPQLRHVSSGGDIVAASVMEQMKALFPRAAIFVIYGSTEISCMGTYFEATRSKRVERSLVGNAFPHVRLRLLDEMRRTVPQGVVGEIAFAGPGLTLGYYGRPDLEEGRFVSIEGERFYLMGDMGRLLPSGELEMLGRRDHQIQLRGIRIELVGIENKVRELGLAQQCALVCHKSEADERLVAFVVKPLHPDGQSFRAALSAHLPDYMLPQHLVVLEAFPLTPNGKLDRKALAALPWRDELSDPDPGRLAGGNGGTEARLTQIFMRVLQRSAIERTQSFFDLGGHSLLAVKLLQEIKADLGIDIAPQLFFEQPSVAGLLQEIKTGRTVRGRPIRLNRSPETRTLFMLSGIPIYRPLALKLQRTRSVYGVFAQEELFAPEMQLAPYTVEELARAYVTQIKSERAEGPYELLGYSFGGLVAYEAARQLEAEGASVAQLILLDAVLPEWAMPGLCRWRQLKRLLRTSPRALWAFFTRRIREKWHARLDGLRRFSEDGRLGPLEAQRDQVNSRAACDYVGRMQPYGGSVLLIVSEERLAQDPLKSRSCGWRPYIRDLSVASVRGDHFAMIEDASDLERICLLIDAHGQAPQNAAKRSEADESRSLYPKNVG